MFGPFTNQNHAKKPPRASLWSRLCRRLFGEGRFAQFPSRSRYPLTLETLEDRLTPSQFPGSQALLDLASAIPYGTPAASVATTTPLTQAQLSSGYSFLQFDAQNRVLVNVHATQDQYRDALESAASGLGMTIASTDTASETFSGWVPAAEILPLSRLPNFATMTPVYRPLLNAGSVTTEGDGIVNAPSFRSAAGIDGTGIKIGVISDSVNDYKGGLSDSVRTGDLPSNVTVLSDDPSRQGSDEGRAMLEIIHDVAPGASLYFATAKPGPLAMVQAIQSLVGDGCNIIVDDVLYPDEPMFNDGLIAQAAANAASSGVLYLSAAGNSSNHGYLANWKSTSATVGGISGTFQEVAGQGSPLQTFTLATGQEMQLAFQWDSFYSEGGTTGTGGGPIHIPNDLEVLITDASGHTLYKALDAETMYTNEAFVLVDFLNNGSYAGNTFAMSFYLKSGTVPGKVRWVSLDNGGTNGITDPKALGEGAPTMYGHALARGVVSVAAVNWNTPTQVESYSSVGGSLPILFDNAGQRFTTPDLRTGPTLAGPDGVHTSFFNVPDGHGGFAFFGTSAAAPHVAAVAALLLEMHSSTSAADVTHFLEESADPISAHTYVSGDLTGNGLVHLDMPTGGFSEYDLPTDVSTPDGIVSSASGLWFTGQAANQGVLAQVSTRGVFSGIPLPMAGSNPWRPSSLAIGTNSSVWFSSNAGSTPGIGYSTASGPPTLFSLASLRAPFNSVVYGPDGNVWVAETATSQIGRFNTTTQQLDQVIPKTQGGAPVQIIVGPDHNLWFVESNNYLGRLTPDGALTEYPITAGGLFGLTVGPDHNLWISESNWIAVFNPFAQTLVASYTLPTGHKGIPGAIIAGSDGNVWFAEQATNVLGRISPRGIITEFAAPTGDAAITSLALGTDNNLWFTEQASNKIGMLALDPPLTLTVDAIRPVNGQALTATVATFTDADATASASGYVASIDWGDGTTSSGQVVADGGKFDVIGSHTYSLVGSYTVKVSVLDQDTSHDAGGSTASGSALATVHTPQPHSTPAPLPAFEPASFVVSWSGADDAGGPGIARYDIYFSDNGSAFTPLLTATTRTSYTFTGVTGHTYGFYSIAIDNNGLREATPANAEATARVDTTPPTSAVSLLPTSENTASFTVSWNGQDDTGGSGIVSFSIYVSDNGAAFQPFLQNTPLTSATFQGVNGHTYSFYSVAVDQIGNVQPTPSGAQATTEVVLPAATHFLVTTPPPASIPSHTVFGLVIEAVNLNGDLDPTFSTSLTIAIGTNPSNGTLGGNLTVVAQAGIAILSGLTVDQPGSGYTLQASGGGLPTVTTAPFDVTGITGVTLSSTSVFEFRPTGTTVGALTANDPGSGHSITYSLVSGAGSGDNSSFSISGNTLLTADAFDFAARSNYSIRVRATDENGVYYEQAIPITIADDPNLTRTGRKLVVSGTQGNDTFTFNVGSPRHRFTLDGVNLAVDTASVDTVAFQGGSGSASATLTGLANRVNLLTLTPGSGTLSGPGYTVVVSNTAQIVAFGGASDTATLTGSSASGNTYVATASSSYVYRTGYFNEAVGFHTVVGYSKGPNDYAQLFDSPGDDSFTGTPAAAYLFTPTFFSEAVGFPVVSALSVLGGRDAATLFDAAGTNTFVGTPTQAYLYGSNYFNGASGFASVVAYSQAGGNDNATLFGGAGVNTLVSTPTYAYLSGLNFILEAAGFKSVAAYNGAGATGAAYFYGSGGADQFTGMATVSSLQGSNFLNAAVGFQGAAVYESGTSAAANLYDTLGNASLIGRGTAATLMGSGYTISLGGFHALGASATGTADHSDILAVDYLFSLLGNWK